MTVFKFDNDNGDRETKVVEVFDERATANAVMMTAFDGDSVPHVGDEGYCGDYIIFTVMGGPQVVSGWKAREMVRDSVMLNKHQGVGAFIITVNDNKELFNQLDDGESIGPDKLEEIVVGHNA